MAEILKAETTKPQPTHHREHVRVDNTDERIMDMVRIMAKVAARDFSEKPPLVEGDDTMSLFTVGFRFMVEDLERSLLQLEQERAELQRANDRLQTLDRAKTRFINTAAHELGTPLTPIILQLALIRQGSHGPLTERQTGSLAMLDRNMSRLAYLVKDMLDVARLESRRMRLRIQPCDVTALAQQCMESFAEQARGLGIQLEVDASGAAHAPADEHRINQVLFNLVSNALKFTPSGGRITLKLEALDERVVVAVQDTGAGLTQEEIGRLFQPFSQVQDGAHSDRGGTGLGLYISRGIVQLHGGRLTCSSKGHGQGSRFEFWIPTHVPPQPVTESSSTSLAGPF